MQILSIRGGNLIPNDSQRADLANFIALLVTRTPGWRDDFEAMVGELGAATARVAARHSAHFVRTFREANKHRNLTDEEIRAFSAGSVGTGRL